MFFFMLFLLACLLLSSLAMKDGDVLNITLAHKLLASNRSRDLFGLHFDKSSPFLLTLWLYFDVSLVIFAESKLLVFDGTGVDDLL